LVQAPIHVSLFNRGPRELAAEFVATTPGPLNMPPTVELTGWKVLEQLDEGTG